MVWQFLYKYLKKSKYLTIGILVALVLEQVAMRSQNYFVSLMVGALTDIKKENIVPVLIKYMSFFAIAMLFFSLTTSFRRFLEARFLPLIYTICSKDLFSMVHKHAMRYFDEEMSGNISGKVTNILNQITNMYGNMLFGFFMPVTSILTSLAFIAMADKKLALILGISNLFFLAITIHWRKKITPYSVERSKTFSAANGVFVDGVTNANLVKSFANYFYEKLFYFKAVRQAATAQKKEMMKITHITLASHLVFDMMSLVSYILVFIWWYRFDLQISGVVLVLSLDETFIMALRNLGYMASSVSQLYGNLKDGLTLLKKDCYVQDIKNAKQLVVKNNEILFKNITFSYPNGCSVFKNFSLNLKPNQKIGLVGASGSGKSTLIKLLIRYYDLKGGKILISGKDISKVTQSSLRNAIAIIPQENTLFNRTLMDNIRYGRPDATDEEVIEAAKKAYIHDFIIKLPLGYESKVGERGVMLSGGERQRIAIARAILKDAPILILDEATSALDSESERYIEKSLKKLMKNKTVIAIAHRLSTLHEMDSLVVLKNGKIVEIGSHKELLKKNGEYAKFYKLQYENK